MAMVLEILGSDLSLSNLEETIRQKEEHGFELIAMARGTAGGQPGNLATFLRRSPGDAPNPLGLKELAGSTSQAQQERELNAGESTGKKLISYGGVFVEGRETNIAVYRG